MMMRQYGHAIGLFLLLFLGVTVVTQSALSQSTKLSAEEQKEFTSQTAMIDKIMRRIGTLQPGCTRADLFKVLTIEGGLSSWNRRTYVYRTCPYVKVDVEFRRSTDPASPPPDAKSFREDNADIVTKLSKPYLAGSIMD